MKYTFEQELDAANEDYLKWFIWDENGYCINEYKPFNTLQGAEAYIPYYEADQADKSRTSRKTSQLPKTKITNDNSKTTRTEI